jgi:hypothetical protein
MTTLIRHLLEVDWDNDNDFNASGEDITGDVESYEDFRGKEYASPLIGRSRAGKLTAKLDNRDGRYSSFNSSSPLFGNLLPGRKVRYSCGQLLARNAALFTSANSEFLSLADNTQLSAGDVAFEIVTFVKATTLPGSGATMGLVGKWTTGDLEYLLFIDNTAGTIRFMFRVRDTANTTTTTVTASTFGTPSTATMYFIHAYHDPTGNIIGIAVNNGAANTQATTGGVRDGGAAFEVGRQDGGSYFNGQVAQLAIFKHATTLLTAAQLTYLYNAGAGRDYSELGIADTDGANIPTTLVEWWRMDETGGARTGEVAGLVLADNATVTSTTGLTLLVYERRWTGLLDRVLASAGALPSAVLEASGILGQFAGDNAAQSPPAQANVQTGTIVGAILDEHGWPAAARDIDVGDVFVGRWYVEDREAIDLLQEIEDTEFGAIFEGTNWDLRYEARYHRDIYSLTSQATFSDAPAATLPYMIDVAQEDPLREIFNYIEATIQPAALTEIAVLWTLENETPTIPAGGSINRIATVRQSDQLYVETWTTPVVGTDVKQTGGTDGNLAVSVSKTARTMFITLTNNGGTAMTITLLQARGTAVLSLNPFKVRVTDATSISTYGRRVFPLTSPWYHNAAFAEGSADYFINRQKDPRPILSLTISPTIDDGLFTHASQREPSDRITAVANNPLTQLGINTDFYIESVANRWAPGEPMMTTWQLSQAHADPGYWILDVSVLGTSTKLAY